MTKGKLFFWACLLFICGIFINSFVNISCQALLGFLFVLAVSLFIFKFDKRLLAVGILLLAFSTGVFRYQFEAGKVFRSKLREFNDADQSLDIVGVIYGEPDSKESSQQLRVRTIDEENLLVITGKYPSYQYGDKIRVLGKLKTPENFEKFNYRGYLQKERIYSIMVFPKIELQLPDQENFLEQALRALFDFKSKFQQTWQKFLSPPHLGIFEALVFGEEENIPKEWKTQLNLSGARHLTAVSGMNITIIGVLLSGIFLSFGLWKQQASLISLVFIWLYILMIGAPASGLRAGLMVSFLLLAQLSGREVNGSKLLVFSAVLILAENPLLLKYDVGFQLSFLAMAGLIYWQLFFKQKVFQKLPEFVGLSLAATFASQVFTLPILIYNFGYISLISPLVNMMLVWIIPYLTMAGIIFGSLGIVFLPLAQILSWFFWLGSGYILLVIGFYLKIPYSHFSFQPVSALFLLAVYPLLGLLTWKMEGYLNNSENLLK